MSIAKVQEIAKAAPGAFVTLPGAALKAALEEHGTPPTDELLAHVSQRVGQNPECTMQVHRDVHLGKLLGVKEPAVTSPNASKLRT